ncbi:MAG: 3-oxoacyl-ACP synthase [Cyclobacteriaceae bacterium]
MNKIKQQLYKYCQQWVDNKITMAKNEINAAQASANEETKSSAGDKYETARAMAQLEIEKSTSQLSEAGKLKRLLGEFSGESETSKAQLGSLIQTNNGWFYISLSAGKVILDDVTYICLSPVSPLGAKMMNLVTGDQFNFNKLDYIILEVN